ncbi:hypothetical protein J14TS2_00770 [Bacillus sp. J14TS2]|nr:hypothetical protein [Bacillus sp. J14TS2]GIN69602.1 hypothetical protein J14TS2_00770 [Bacillus sp. J14TS2]
MYIDKKGKYEEEHNKLLHKRGLHFTLRWKGLEVLSSKTDA